MVKILVNFGLNKLVFEVVEGELKSPFLQNSLLPRMFVKIFSKISFSKNIFK